MEVDEAREVLTTEPDPAVAAREAKRKYIAWKTAEVVGVAVLCLVVVIIYEAARGNKSDNTPVVQPAVKLSAVPRGVNFGGWLCLEDWFYSGASGRNVMSLQLEGQGACLPPQVTGLPEPWPSEGLLTQRLVRSRGAQAAAEAFEAHRRAYINDQDLAALEQLGVRSIRVPLTWAAFADALAPFCREVYGAHDPEAATAIVPDPFYTQDAAFATVPRGWLRQLLRKAAGHGLKVLLDLHAFPGGAADGTYNGIWPNRPAFWNDTVNATFWSNVSNGSAAVNTNTTLMDLGHLVAAGLVHWLEGLDSAELNGVGGVTLMNEPAHMAAIDASQGKPFAKESDVLAWLAQSADVFRRSTLPQKGIKLYVNMIETAFHNWNDVINWWSKTFTEQERNAWAVIDVHWYSAWSGGTCDGRVVSGGGYYCDDPMDKIRETLRTCVRSFTDGFSKSFPNMLRATSEFSVGTFQDARLACTDRALVNAFLQEQVEAMSGANIEMFFWTWRMPYGHVFQPGWSLKFLAGLEEASPTVPCQEPLIGH